MSSITVHLRGMSGTATLELPEESTIADVRSAAAEAGSDLSGLSVRADGRSVSDDAIVRDEQVLVTTPPEAKHGLR